MEIHSAFNRSRKFVDRTKFKAYLQLMRPANILTAWADILLGWSAAGVNFYDGEALGWLILATTGLYGGGVVFNDVFDAPLDAIERPERPIPSKHATMIGAITLGFILMLGGVIAGYIVSPLSGTIALILAGSALTYDRWGKHHVLLGPLNMGCCRGLNLLLGMSIVPSALGEHWYLILIPILYIAAITAISQGEVHGGRQSTGMIAMALVILVISSVLGLDLSLEYSVINALPLLILFGSIVLPKFAKAALQPEPVTIQQAVKAGVLALIILDGAIAAGFAGWIYGLGVLALLPMSLWLGKIFAIT